MINNLLARIVVAILVPVAVWGCQKKQASLPVAEMADIILTNGKIFTGNSDQPWAEALAIKDGLLLAVGSSEEVAGFEGDSTQVGDLLGQMAMPGIIDAHVHTLEGATKELYECKFAFSSGPAEIRSAIEACVAADPEAVWIKGGQWGSDFFVQNPMENPKAWLDEFTGDIAVFLRDDAYHNAWFNSKALELIGVDRNTPNPPGVKILKHPESGEPSGVILETFGFSSEVVPDWTAEQYLEAAIHVTRVANSFGLTGVKSASATDKKIQAFLSLDAQGGLTMNYAAALETPYGHREESLNVEELIGRRDAMGSEHVDTRYVKIFTDGVPTAARTAAMLAPYTKASPDAELTLGELHVSEDVLISDVVALDRAGFTVKIHTAGDRSVRVALNAIEAARSANGLSGLRHELAHAGYISREDIPRFGQLSAVADFSPYLWYMSPIIKSVVDAVGLPRGGEYWPTRTLIESGAPILVGSDWPAAAFNMSPWIGIEAMVTRKDPLGDSDDQLWAEEAVTLEQAINIYTRGGAAAIRREHSAGSLEVGKSADLIVLNHNIFEIPIEMVSETEVEMTFFEGKLVFER